MPKLILLFNHRLTARQEAAAREELGVAEILAPSVNIQELWSDVPPAIPHLQALLAPVCDWLAAVGKEGDFVLVQGDFGACYLLVHFALERNFIPVYATTERHAREEHLNDGRVRLEHTFNHVRFRRYGE